MPLNVADVMTANPVTISPETPLETLISLMKERGCRQLPVLDDNRLVGIVTDRDIRLAMNSPLTLRDRIEDEMLLHSLKAADCMTPDPMTIDVHESAVLAADLLRTYKFGALPVLEQGRLVGIVTVSDILQAFINVVKSHSASV